jgi:hypothetical protein
VPTNVKSLLNSTLSNAPGLNKILGRFLGGRPSLQVAGMTTNAVAIAKLGLFNVSAGNGKHHTITEHSGSHWIKMGWCIG